MDIDPEGVLVLTPGGPGEQDPGLDDELGDELERPEALLDRLLQLRGGREVSAVSNAADEASVKTQFLMLVTASRTCLERFPSVK